MMISVCRLSTSSRTVSLMDGPAAPRGKRAGNSTIVALPSSGSLPCELGCVLAHDAPDLADRSRRAPRGYPGLAQAFDHPVTQQNGEDRAIHQRQADVGFDQQIIVGHAGGPAEVDR